MRCRMFCDYQLLKIILTIETALLGMLVSVFYLNLALETNNSLTENR